MDVPFDALLAKIERLWRQAQRTPYPHEAEAFEAKALRLMAQHQVSMAMLDIDGDDPIVDVQVGDPLQGRYRTAIEMLFAAVCQAYDCRPWFTVFASTSTCHAVGFRSDVDRVRFLYPLLATQALSDASALPGSGSAALTMRRRRNFLFGFCSEIAQRLSAVRTSVLAEADAVQPTTTSASLVLVERARRVDEVFSAKRLGSRTVQGPTVDGYEQGRAAGQRADLSGGRSRLGREVALGAGR